MKLQCCIIFVLNIKNFINAFLHVVRSTESLNLQTFKSKLDIILYIILYTSKTEESPIYRHPLKYDTLFGVIRRNYISFAFVLCYGFVI